MVGALSGQERLRYGRAALVAAVASLTVPLLVTSGGGAHATYPGEVGELAFAISVGGNVDIYSAQADGSGLTRLTDDPGFDACSAYSPSGKQIAFCSDRSGDFEIWTMDEDGEGEEQLTDLEGRVLWSDFSPSGNHVAFDGSRDPAASPEIWRIRNDGTHLRRLTVSPGVAERHPVWRPGHEQIAFLRTDDFLGSQIWLMRADGAKQRPLTTDDTVKGQVHDWSPDGRRLAYEADGDIWVMRADGSGQRNLTQSEVAEFGAAWSPDGARIAFVRDDPGDTRPVYTMRADGSDQQLLLPTNDNPQFVPAWQPAPRERDCTPEVRDLGTLGGPTSEVIAMNGDGLVVGSSRRPNGGSSPSTGGVGRSTRSRCGEKEGRPTSTSRGW